MMHGLYWLVANLAARRPLLLLADDLHWWDVPSLRFLAYLIPRVEELPVTVVAAARLGEPGADGELLGHISRAPGALVTAPGPLSERATRELAVACFADADEEFCVSCHRATGGNPLLLRELLAALASERDEAGRGLAARVSELGPLSVLRAVIPRLARLGPGAVDLARAVAVLGVSAELRHAAALAGLDAERAAALADELAAAEILTGASPLGFAHPIVGAAIYADMPAASRARWHARAARLLDSGGARAGQVAAQVLVSGPMADMFAVEALRAAAAEAVAQGAPETAVSYLARALAEPPPRDERVPLLLDLAAAQAQTDDRAAMGTLTRALAESRDPCERARAAVPLGNLLMLAGQMDAGEQVMAAAFAELDALADQTAGDRDLLLAVAAERNTAARMGNRPADPRVQALVSGAARGKAPPDSPGTRAIAAVAAGDTCTTVGIYADPKGNTLTLAERFESAGSPHGFSLTRNGTVLALLRKPRTIGLLVFQLGRHGHLLGLVPLGNHPRGLSRIRWSLRVGGKRLHAGTYIAELVATFGRGVTSDGPSVTFDLTRAALVRVRSATCSVAAAERGRC
jgi:hypothetical protein